MLEHREAGLTLKAQAVLFRTAHHSAALELELARRNIPFVKFGGLKFLEAAHIKDVLAILRLLENPRDEVSWFRVLQLLDGIGPTGARHSIAIPAETRSSLASKSARLANTLPKSTNADSRAAGLLISVGKNISIEPTVLIEPPSGCWKLVAVKPSRGPRVLSRKPRTELVPPA